MASQTPAKQAAEKRETVVSFRLYVEDRDRLRALAESRHRTLSGELRRIIEASFQAPDRSDQEAA